MISLEKSNISIPKLDFMFRNAKVAIIANSDYHEIELAGSKIGPFMEGGEYEVRYWIATELIKRRLAKFKEEQIDSNKLYKIQWKERVQSYSQITESHKNFYPSLRRFLKELSDSSVNNPEKLVEYKKARQLSQDIVNLRLKKIVSLASSKSQTFQGLKNLTPEEKILFERISNFILSWREQIFNGEKTKQ